MKRGQIVFSKAGRDKSHFLVVLSVQGNRCTVADGRRRRVEKPKCKNIKHLGATNGSIAEEDLFSNRLTGFELPGRRRLPLAQLQLSYPEQDGSRGLFDRNSGLPGLHEVLCLLHARQTV